MSQKLSPFIESRYGWDFGESGWNLGMDDNILKFSFLFERNIDAIVETLPPVVNGKAYYLTTDKRLYFAVGGVYYSTPVPKWFRVVIRTSGEIWQFNGLDLELIPTPDALQQELASAGGAALVGFGSSTVADLLGQINRSVKLASSYPSIQDAVSAMQDNETLVIDQPYEVSTHVLLTGLQKPEIQFTRNGKLTAAPGFAFSSVHRGILVFENCFKPTTRSPNIQGLALAKPGNLFDGDAGIEYLNCTGPQTIGRGNLTRFMTWGIIHVGCTDTLVDGPMITRCTQQSGVGHANVTGGIVRNTIIDDVGLYGVEIEGADNRGIIAYSNKITRCLKGAAIVSNSNDCHVFGNVISQCRYGLNSNPLTSAASGNSLNRNTLSDCVCVVEAAATNALDVIGNTYVRTATDVFTHARAEDYICGVVDSVTVHIRDSASANITVGDAHQYAGAGVTLTVQAVSVESIPVYGSVARVTYSSDASVLSFGDAFMRQISLLTGSRFAEIVAGELTTDGLRFTGNVFKGAAEGYYLQGAMNNCVIDNDIRDVTNLFNGADGTLPTDTQLVFGAGHQSDIDSLGVGFYSAKCLPSVVGTSRQVKLDYNKPSGFTLRRSAFVASITLTLFNTSATGGDAVLSLNGNEVLRIAAAEVVSKTVVSKRVPFPFESTSFALNLADTVGDLTFGSAVVDLDLIEV